MATVFETPHVSPYVIDYPDSDGQPMAENTKQFQWIVTIKENLDALLPAAFVAGDLFWYPVEGNNNIKQAPDVLVALGRPKGHRGSYRQWEEANIPPQVVFEVLSPGNRVIEMAHKERFYARHGVMEYYIYDPDTNELAGWQREAGQWRQIDDLQGWHSPLLGIQFELTADTLVLYRPDGSRFETFAELLQAKEAAVEGIVQERQAKEAARAEATQERQAKEAALAEAAQVRQAAEALRAELAQLQRQLEAARHPPS